MPLTLTAQTVRLVSSPWEMNGRSGVSHKVTVADGPDLIVVTVPEDLFEALPDDVVSSLAAVGSWVECDLEAPRVYQGDRGGRLVLKVRAVRVVRSAVGLGVE